MTAVYRQAMPAIAKHFKAKVLRFQVADAHGPPSRQPWELSRKRANSPEYGTYLRSMSAAMKKPSRDLQLVRWGHFVKRVLDNARARGMTIADIVAKTKIGKSTLYRWRDGESLPGIEELRRFCDGLSIPIAEAYAVLGWSEVEQERPAQPAPLIEDPDVRALMRKLSSPTTPAAEKLAIRRMIRALAGTLEDTDDQ